MTARQPKGISNYNAIQEKTVGIKICTNGLLCNDYLKNI